MEEKLYTIHYQFWFDKHDKKDFEIAIDLKTILMVPPELKSKPDWTRLEYKQCKCCSLTKEEYPYCPAAINIALIVDTFKNRISYEKCVVKCITPERIYQKRTSLMEGLSSLLGLVMATSNCPVMFPFKPMARFHLPFSTIEETIARTTSMYLLRQYFVHTNNNIQSLSLKELNDTYNTLKILNNGLLSRIKDIDLMDSDKNAILIFHSLSDLLSMEIDSDLTSIEYLFNTSFNS